MCGFSDRKGRVVDHMILDPLLVPSPEQVRGRIKEPLRLLAISAADSSPDDVEWRAQSDDNDLGARHGALYSSDERASLENPGDDQPLSSDGSEIRPHARKVPMAKLLVPRIGSVRERLLI